MMKLMTKEIEKKLPELGTHDSAGTEDIRVVAKYFTPDSSWTWYVTEGNKEGDDWRFFGWVDGHYPEFGYFMLSDLESVRGCLGLGVERDRYFTAKLSEVM
jgi:hypothetical protein|tara:strand:- start:346 stop:648 length:303 start_codon:yes stop_codon:yes gene_type:complete